jgi:hypothetical protein
VNLSTIQEYVALGKLVPKQNDMITMRDLVRAGLTTNPQDGIKLLGQVHFRFTFPIFDGLLETHSIFDFLWYRVLKSSTSLFTWK